MLCKLCELRILVVSATVICTIVHNLNDIIRKMFLIFELYDSSDAIRNAKYYIMSMCMLMPCVSETRHAMLMKRDTFHGIKAYPIKYCYTLFCGIFFLLHEQQNSTTANHVHNVLIFWGCTDIQYIVHACAMEIKKYLPYFWLFRFLPYCFS